MLHAALKWCLKPEQERQTCCLAQTMVLRWCKKRKENLQTGREEQTSIRERWVKRLGFRDQMTVLDRLNSPQRAKKINRQNETHNLWQILVNLGSGQLNRLKKGCVVLIFKKKATMHFEDCLGNSITVLMKGLLRKGNETLLFRDSSRRHLLTITNRWNNGATGGIVWTGECKRHLALLLIFLDLNGHLISSAMISS